MGYVDSKTFTSGNSVALRLPKSLGFGPNVAVRIERHGAGLTVMPIVDADEQKRRVHAMIEALRVLPKPDRIEVREPIEFRDR